jgi:hypothetical protein
MTDFNPNSATPSLLAQALASLARHGLTALAGSLGTAGVLTHDQQTQFVTVGGALALAGVSYAWSYIQKRNAKKA